MVKVTLGAGHEGRAGGRPVQVRPFLKGLGEGVGKGAWRAARTGFVYCTAADE
jgi:hypothetical protein